MNHSPGAVPGQGVPGVQSLTCEVAGRLGPFIEGPQVVSIKTSSGVGAVQKISK